MLKPASNPEPASPTVATLFVVHTKASFLPYFLPLSTNSRANCKLASTSETKTNKQTKRQKAKAKTKADAKTDYEPADDGSRRLDLP